MSGHSKWATIHRKKGELDAQRGKVFQKIAKEIYIAARGTNGDPDSNPSLRAVLEKARANNMPRENIQRAIDKATGNGDQENYESIRYEGYGSGGAAIMIDCLTDNRNRTAMLVRSTLTKKGGNLGTDGSVSYLFERKGVIVIDKSIDMDTIMMAALDNGAQDIVEEDENYIIYTDSDALLKVKDALSEVGVKEFSTCEVSFVANNPIELDEENTDKVMELVTMLEDIDDVQAVYHNVLL
jgi:YebC/PmpR family DNA-binding regulatory protein